MEEEISFRGDAKYLDILLRPQLQSTLMLFKYMREQFLNYVNFREKTPAGKVSYSGEIP